MIITKTPFRVSFFGGGTDYPEYFEQHGGAVLGTGIHHFAYLSATRFLSRLFDYNMRIAYRQVECVSSIDEIQHGPFREALRWCGIERDIEVDYTSELPSFSGLGSSSTFTVGLLHALHAYRRRAVRGLELAYEAIKLEREVLREAVGCQDQVFAAVGGFNVIEFRRVDDISVHRIPLSAERMQYFQDHLYMCWTGIKRRAADVATKQIKKVADNRERLLKMRRMVDDAHNVLTSGQDLTKFGELLHETWMLKRSLDAGVSNDTIETIYDTGRAAGAIGGKLLGAGGGGFVLFFVPPDKRAAVREALSTYEEVPIAINAPGSHIIHS